MIRLVRTQRMRAPSSFVTITRSGGLIAMAIVVVLMGAYGPDSDLLAIRKAGEALKPLQKEMPPAQKGDWVLDHPESGQTFDKYLKSNPNRPQGKRTTLYVQPLGEFRGRDKKSFDLTVEMLAIFYNMPVKTLGPIDLKILPDSARRVHPKWGMKQVDSLAILELLRKNRPVDAVGVLGLTATDLWPNEKGRAWNFVFGQASLGDRVGVWSTARLGNPETVDKLFLQRTLKVAIHETGHMLGIYHCLSYECGMNGSNSLTESDRQIMPFCSECEMKIWWSCGTQIAERYKKLEVFAEQNDLDSEAKFWKSSAGILK